MPAGKNNSGGRALSRQARGLGADYGRLRPLVMRRDGYLCQCPDCKGGELRLTPANEVDHIIPREVGGKNTMSNLRAVNSECHKKLTAAQGGYKLHPGSKLDGSSRDPSHHWNVSGEQPGGMLQNSK